MPCTLQKDSVVIQVVPILQPLPGSVYHRVCFQYANGCLFYVQRAPLILAKTFMHRNIRPHRWIRTRQVPYLFVAIAIFIVLTYGFYIRKTLRRKSDKASQQRSEKIILDRVEAIQIVVADEEERPFTVVRQAYHKPNILYWDAYCSCTGLNVEAANLVIPLQQNTISEAYEEDEPILAAGRSQPFLSEVRAACDEKCWCEGFPPQDNVPLYTMVENYRDSVAKEAMQELIPLADEYRIWVAHKPADAFPVFPESKDVVFVDEGFVDRRAQLQAKGLGPRFEELSIPTAVRIPSSPYLPLLQKYFEHNPIPGRNPFHRHSETNGYVVYNGHPLPRPNYVVGRTMLELDRVPLQWLENIKERVDEVWLPAPFLVDVLCDSLAAHSNANALAGGLPPMFVIPESIDTVSLFNPRLFSINSTSAAKSKKGKPKPKRLQSNVLPVAHMLRKDVRQKFSTQPYRFFSNFKWESRKGWEALLEAYFRAFTSSDNVVLYLKTYLYLDPDSKNAEKIKGIVKDFGSTLAGMPMLGTDYFEIVTALKEDLKPTNDGVAGSLTPDGFSRILDVLKANMSTKGDVKAFLEALGKPANDTFVDTAKLPKIIVLTDDIPMAALPSVYASMDAFVLPTRGEGWGLPLMEAMAMGLPTIGTNWGGNTAFMDESNSLLVHNEGMAVAEGINSVFQNRYQIPQLEKEVIGGDASVKYFPRHEHRPNPANVFPAPPLRASIDRSTGRGICSNRGDTDASRQEGRWATPSVEHLAYHMRFLLANPSAGRSIGEAARRFISKNFSRNQVATVIEHRLHGILVEQKQLVT